MDPLWAGFSVICNRNHPNRDIGCVHAHKTQVSVNPNIQMASYCYVDRGPQKFQLVVRAPVPAAVWPLGSILDLKNYRLSLSPPKLNMQLQGYCPNLPFSEY